jgi:hypothetical protein
LFAARQAVRNPLFTLQALVSYFQLFRDLELIRHNLQTFFPAEFATKDWQVRVGASAGLKEIALYTIVRKYKPRVMVETGVAQGVSTYFLLKAMERNRYGRLMSVDLPNYDKDDSVLRTYIPRGLKPGWLVPENLKRRWEIRIGPSSAVLPLIPRPIDAFLHDSLHNYGTITLELEWAYGAVRRGGVIMCDDAWWNSAWIDFQSRHRNAVKTLRSPFPAVEKLD